MKQLWLRFRLWHLRRKIEASFRSVVWANRFLILHPDFSMTMVRTLGFQLRLFPCLYGIKMGWFRIIIRRIV